MTTMARRERSALCDLALVLGEDAPTLCGGWAAKELVAHLLVRERSLLGAPGIVVPFLAGLTEREMERVARAGFAVMVERLRTPRFTPVALTPVDALVNTVEFFVHHEDLRRAQPGWEPRALSDADEELLWKAVRVTGRGLVRPAHTPVVAAWPDRSRTATLASGADPVTVSGRPSEVLLFLYGRREVDGVSFDGPPDAVARLRGADLGL